MARIFAKTTNTGFITKDADGSPLLEEKVNTYRVRKTGNKFIVEQLFRKKQKPKRIKTIAKNRLNSSENAVAERIQKEQIHINVSEKTVYKNNISKTEIEQTNYISRSKRRAQIIAIIKIEHVKTGDAGIYLAFSQKTDNYPTRADFQKAREEAINYAKAQFIEDYPYVKNSKNELTAEILEERYMYFKKSFKQNG